MFDQSASSNRFFSFILVPFFIASSVSAAELKDVESVRMPSQSTRGMVVADDRQAAEWGAEILRRGGNAIDAAVATAFAMSVTRPHYAALGGGGFLVFCPSAKRKPAADCSVIDFREKAPAAAHRDMFIHNGKADSQLSQNGALASGVPGVTAGLLFALEKFGTRSRKELLTEPIRLARRGVRVSSHTERAAQLRWSSMNKEAQRVFGCGRQPQGPCAVGEILRQPDLAMVLKSISQRGVSGFYQGVVAKKIVDSLSTAGGRMTLKDLADYRPTERKPIRSQFQGYEVITMPPPSSGGTVLTQLLAYSDFADKSQQFKNGFASVESLHAQIHAMSLAFADRTQHMGDADFYPVPMQRLLAEDYLQERWKTFQPLKANLPEAPGAISQEPQHTTHFSVIDAEGNAVAITETVNDNFGSGFVPAGTGVVMNNQMDDFSAQPGVPNLFGLIGAEANAIAPGKRPLSSMTPTIVRDKEQNVRLVLGAAGGPRIITSVYQTLINRIQFGMSLVDAVAAPRIHHQWRPQNVRFEKNGLSYETQEQLKKFGYAVDPVNGLAVVHALERLPSGRVIGAPDPRGEGAAVGE